MIEIKHLSKDYGVKKALDHINMIVPSNAIEVVLGPSGCGKTTLLRLIAGFEQPTSGEIRIKGRTVSSNHRMVLPNQRQIGMIFQDLALWPHMTAYENGAFGLKGKKINRVEIRQKVDEALYTVSLLENKNRFPQHLSGGEKQRLALARAIAAEPAYLLMDEPFGSLDPMLKQSMMELLMKTQQKSSLSICYVTHHLEEALKLADHITLMHRGNIVRVADRNFFGQFSTEELLAWCVEAF